MEICSVMKTGIFSQKIINSLFYVCFFRKEKKKDFPEAIKQLHSALSFKTEMTGMVNEAIRQMKNQVNDPSQDAADEYHSLAIQLKTAVNSMMSQGMYQEAFSIPPAIRIAAGRSGTASYKTKTFKYDVEPLHAGSGFDYRCRL